jgi:hypothetical protein
VAQAEALAAERARQAREDKLNAAIPGRKFRKQGKLKPGALTPGPNSATHHAKGQPTGPSKGKPGSQKSTVVTPPPLRKAQYPKSSKKTDNQYDITTFDNEWGKDPP